MTVPRPTRRRRWADAPADRVVPAALLTGALAAAGLALGSGTPSHVAWGAVAAVVQLVAAARCLRGGPPAAALRLAGWGTAVVPLVVLVLAGVHQPEVGVVQRSAESLLQTGSPYVADVRGVDDVNPYLPLMSVFGLPGQLFAGTPLADPRPWFLAALLGCLWAAGRTPLPDTAPAPRAGSVGALLASPLTRTWAVLACPLVALHAAVGGHDLPVVGLAVLGLTWAAAGRPVAAGLALGAGAAMHALVWPVVPVALALLVTRHGRRTGLVAAAVAGGLVLAVTLPVVLGPDGSTAVAQLAGFPLGAADLVSPADTPFPGVLLGLGAPPVRLLGLGLLAVAAGAVVVRLVLRPPTSLAGAAVFAAGAVTVAVLLLPASRSGYLLLPAALALWAAGTADRTPPERLVPPTRVVGAAPA